jgi:hypothetical protein
MLNAGDRLAGKTKQGATSIVNFGWHICIIKTMFINNAPSSRLPTDEEQPRNNCVPIAVVASLLIV